MARTRAKEVSMSRANLLRSAAFVLGFSGIVAHAAPQAATPHLRHSTAPFIGSTLTLEIEGAPPLSPIVLYFSPQPGSRAMPYGTLELDSGSLQQIANGAATAAGTWSFALPIPLQESLAETGAHFQALVDDPAAPAGKVFTDAVHARLLGSRVYAGFRGGNPGYGSHRTGLFIVSAVTDEVVARVDYGISDSWEAFQHEGKPVFDAAFSRGAVMSTERELLLFDPFFGGVLGRIPFASPCSRTLLTDPERRVVHVLETAGLGSPARIHAIEFASGAETAHLDLPNVAEAIWCSGRADSEAFLAEFEPGGRTAVRWIGLDPLVDRGSTAVGTPGSSSFRASDGYRDVPLPMVFASGQLFVSTRDPASGLADAILTRCRASASGIDTWVYDLGNPPTYEACFVLAAVPAANRILAGLTVPGLGGGMYQARLSTTRPPTPLPPLPPPQGYGTLNARDIVADGKIAWVIGEWEWAHSDILYRLDLETLTWAATPHNWFFGPKDAELIHDAWNHELWVSNVGYGPPVNIAPEILVLDEIQGTTRHIALAHTAEVLHAVPLP